MKTYHNAPIKNPASSAQHWSYMYDTWFPHDHSSIRYHKESRVEGRKKVKCVRMEIKRLIINEELFVMEEVHNVEINYPFGAYVISN